MNAAPSFTLPACPICSSILLVERPFWRSARMVTHATGKPHFVLTGCEHAMPPGRPPMIYGDPEEWAFAEENWATVAAALLADRVASWEPAAVERFCREIGDAVPKLSPPEAPAKQKPKTENRKHR